MSNALSIALISQLVKTGVLDQDDIEEMVASLERFGHEDEALQAKGAFVEAMLGTSSDAEFARSKLRVIDGGNQSG